MRKRLLNPNVMTLKYILSIWASKVKECRCSKCGSNSIIDEEEGTVLRCVICGDRIYKNYPKRSSRYDFCLICNCYYIAPVNNPDRGMCDDCLKTLNRRQALIARKKRNIIRAKIVVIDFTKARKRLHMRRQRLNDRCLMNNEIKL